MKALEEKAFCKQNCQNDSEFDYSAIKFPIDNSETNLMSNENILSSNVVFVEFDLNNNYTSKEHLKFFKDINNEYVDKEIYFVLNVKNNYLGFCTWQANV
jgi:hypothetical protein